jgi:hypothetical protein
MSSISKNVLKESDTFTENLKAAKAADNRKEIDEKNDKIYKTRLEEQKYHWLEEDQLAFALRSQAEVFLCEKRNLVSSRLRGIESATEAWEKFHRPYKEEITRDLIQFYGKYERQKAYREISTDYDETFALPVHKLRTNLPSIIAEALKKISSTIEWIRGTYVSLSEMLERVEALEKSLPVDFPFTEVRIFGDAEFHNFSTFFGIRGQIENPAWIPTIHSEQVLQMQLDGIEALKKPKSFTVA